MILLCLKERQSSCQLSGGNVRNIILYCSHHHLDNIHHLLLAIWQLHLQLHLSSISWLCLHTTSTISTFSSQSSKHFIWTDRNLQKGRDSGSEESCSRHHHQTSPIRSERYWNEQNSALLHGIFQWTSHSPQVEHESWHWYNSLVTDTPPCVSGQRGSMTISEMLSTTVLCHTQPHSSWTRLQSGSWTLLSWAVLLTTLYQR